MNAKRKAPVDIASIAKFKAETKSNPILNDQEDDESDDFSADEQKSSTKTNNETSMNNDQSLNNLSKYCFLVKLSIFFIFF